MTTSCTSVPYNGSVCKEQLSAWQQCALGETVGSSVRVNASGMLEENERLASSLLMNLRLLNLDGELSPSLLVQLCIETLLLSLCFLMSASSLLYSSLQSSFSLPPPNFTSLLSLLGSQCLQNILPFLCQYSFPLCDPAAGDLLLPSREECRTISLQVCMREWQFAQLIPRIAALLPDCSRLPSVPSGV